MGTAIRHWFTTSGVGVIKAAAVKIRRMAYFRFLPRKDGVTIPTRPSMVRTSGSSKTRPKARSRIDAKLKYSAMEGMGWITSVPKLNRYLNANGKTIK